MLLRLIANIKKFTTLHLNFKHKKIPCLTVWSAIKHRTMIALISRALLTRVWTRSSTLFLILWLFSFHRCLHKLKQAVYLQKVTIKTKYFFMFKFLKVHLSMFFPISHLSFNLMKYLVSVYYCIRNMHLISIRPLNLLGKTLNNLYSCYEENCYVAYCILCIYTNLDNIL